MNFCHSFSKIYSEVNSSLFSDKIFVCSFENVGSDELLLNHYVFNFEEVEKYKHEKQHTVDFDECASDRNIPLTPRLFK